MSSFDRLEESVFNPERAEGAKLDAAKKVDIKYELPGVIDLLDAAVEGTGNNVYDLPRGGNFSLYEQLARKFIQAYKQGNKAALARKNLYRFANEIIAAAPMMRSAEETTA